VLATHFKASFDASGAVSSFMASVIRHLRLGTDARTWAPWGILPSPLTAERADNASAIDIGSVRKVYKYDKVNKPSLIKRLDEPSITTAWRSSMIS